MPLPFSNLPPQASINLRADAYGETALRISRLVAMTTRCSLDIPYGNGAAHRLDIYMPADRKLKDLPVYISIHGGGWMFGYKEWMGVNAPPIIAAPAIYIAIEYSLAPQAKHPTQINDCVAALAWVYKNVGRYGGDPNRIFVGGHSAGGHLSSLLTVRHDLREKAGLPRDVIKACFPYSGVYDMRDLVVYGQPASPGPADAMLTSPDQARDASPIVWLEGNETPFFITWGENDNILCRAEGPAFVVALQEQPGRVESHMFGSLDHFWVHLIQEDPENLWTKTLVAWMNGDPKTTPIPAVCPTCA